MINKVVPPDQNFKNIAVSDNKEFRFNLYKNGKPHLVVVNESLPFWNDPVKFNKLYYSKGRDQNFVGTLLEKALVELHFKGDYGLAHGVDAVTVLASFENGYFEAFHDTDLSDFGYKLKDLITHGKKTNSLMVISFKNKVSKYNIRSHHSYSLIDHKDDIVKLYNPHGKTLMIPINILVENIARLNIFYVENAIFRIPTPKTAVDFSDSWNGSDKRNTHVDYELIVEKDDTEVLVNIHSKKYNDIVRVIQIIPINDNTTSSKEENGTDALESVTSGNHAKSSLRAVLRKGKYTLRFLQKVYDRKISKKPLKYSDYLENDKNYFFFRFAASKQCNVRKFD